MTWYMDGSVTIGTRMLGAMNNVLSDGNHMNDNNITISSASLSDDDAVVAVASLWYGNFTVPTRQ